ncbi:hypothetical protein TWF730_001750 [Orbilia blumenaviensis]|uniref:GST C-terminal domain-containing protein n=1 Tax=Orbilia blumenaviensis TaxID=1796055 RepID=A0AAV9ULP2_9PEZI
MTLAPQHNYWGHTSPPGIPTVYSLTDSGSIRVLWALEELVGQNALESYNLKAFERSNTTKKAPEAMKEGFRLGKAPILTVSPAATPDEPPTPFVEGRLILQFLADHYAKGIWDSLSPEDQARNIFFQEFAGTTISTLTSLTLTMDMIPEATPWPFKPLVKLLFVPLLSVFKETLVEPFKLLEDTLSDEKPWFGGSRLGLADFCMIFPLDTCVARRYFDAGKYPNIIRWHKTVHELPAYQRAVKKMGGYNDSKI